MRLIFNIVVSCLLTFSSFAQWEEIQLSDFADAILSVENRIPEKTSYSLESNYLLFEELTGDEPKMTLQSSIVYNESKQIINVDQFGKLLIQNHDIQLNIDTAEKIIVLNNPEMSYFKRKGMEDFDALLKSQCIVKRKSSTTNDIYSIEFAPGARYRGAEIWIEKNGLVTKYILYSGVDVLDDSNMEDKTIHPRMEVSYTNYKTGKDAETISVVEPTEIFSDLKNLTPTVIYKDYEIIDLRN